MSRRGLFGGMAAAGVAAGVAVAAGPAEEHNEGIPNFKYDIEKQTHWVGEGGSAKEATIEEFPISKSIAGVSMRLKPGAIRELHWHSLAAEWAYMLEGRCRVTVISPDGTAETADFEPGDTWYFPRGHGHALQGMGPGETHFLLGFDNGGFSEFGTFSVTDWMARTPPHILARNLGVPESALANLPQKELYIGPGKLPPAQIDTLRNSGVKSGPMTHKYRLGAQKPIVFEGGEERIVTSKEFPIQTTLTAARLDMKAGALRELHWHPHADEWQYYVRGSAKVTIFGSHGRVRTEEFGPGHVAFIPQGFGHYVEVGDQDTQILVLFNSGVYQEISLSAWLGANPSYLLETNFGLPRSVVDRLPKQTKGMIRA